MNDSMFPDFPHNVDEEPTEDWAVEDLMKWSGLRAHQTLDGEHDDRIAALNQQAQAGKDEIWKLHEQHVKSLEDSVLQEVTMEEGNKNEEPKEEDAQPSKRTAAASSKPAGRPKRTKRAAKKEEAPAPSIFVTVTGGTYEGKTFELFPTRNKCFVGRSAGKKCKTGMSFPKDPEVSTTHGKFEFKNGKMYYTDMGSTNGTLHGEEELEDNVPLELTEGMVLQLGATIISISLRNLE